MEKILVVGATGNLGRRLLQEPFRGHSMGTFFKNPMPGLVFLDLSNSECVSAIMTDIRPDVVLFAGGMTGVDECEANPELAFQVNGVAAQLMATFPNVRTVYYSTDYVFDGKVGQYSENSRPTPINVYGESKRCGEELVLQANPGNLVIRVSGLYASTRSNSLPYGRGHGPIYAEDDRFSSPVHLDDVAQATRLLLETGASGIYHVAGPCSLSRYEFQQVYTYLTQLETEVIPITSHQRKRLARRPGDTSLTTGRVSALGWKARSMSEHLQLSNRDSFRDHPLPRNGAKRPSLTLESGIRAILVDCVGGLLTPRTWVQSNNELDYIDELFGQLESEHEFFRRAPGQRYSKTEFLAVAESISRKYGPNPPVWSNLRYWKTVYKLALVNNGLSASFRRWVDRYELNQIFDVLANSEEMGIRKPHPDFFRSVAARLGVLPQQCILIDDDEQIIKGAKSSGLKTLKTRPLGSYPLSIHALPMKVHQSRYF